MNSIWFKKGQRPRQIHVSEENCSEVIAMRGDVKSVMSFVKQVKAIKGIPFCELVPLYAFHHGDARDDGGPAHDHAHPHEHRSR